MASWSTAPEAPLLHLPIARLVRVCLPARQVLAVEELHPAGIWFRHASPDRFDRPVTPVLGIPEDHNRLIVWFESKEELAVVLLVGFPPFALVGALTGFLEGEGTEFVVERCAVSAAVFLWATGDCHFAPFAIVVFPEAGKRIGGAEAGAFRQCHVDPRCLA